MKQLVLLAILFCSLTLTAATVQPGLKISQYPNRGTPHGSDLFILAVTNTSPSTNMNVTFNQVSNAIVAGIPGSSGFANLETLINAVRVGLSTNQNWVSGVTGVLVGTTVTLGVDIFSITNGLGGDAGGTNSRQGGTLTLTNLASNPNVVTNILGAGTVTVTSNNLGTFTITGAASSFGVGLAPGTTTIVVDGSVDGIYNRTSVLTSDVSVLFENLIVGVPTRWWGFASNGAWNVTVPQSHDSNIVSRGIEQPFTNNWVWVEALRISTAWTNFDSKAPPFTIGPGTNTVFDTNLITRHISVSAAAGAVSTGFETNQYTTNRSLTPVQGSFWFGDTNGTQLTNGRARVAMEWIPVMRAFRRGELGDQGPGHDTVDTTLVTNYWNATNTGFGSYVSGSNNMARGNYSMIGNGMFNIIGSNAVAAFIGNGSNNIVDTNAVFSVITGGAINKIRMGSRYSTISGGNDHSINDSDFATVGGGFQCTMVAGCDNSTISGGSVNVMSSTASGSATIGGGAANQINGNSAFSTIDGGNQNTITTASQYGSIGGGLQNSLASASDYSVIGGGQANSMSGVTRAFIGSGNANSMGSSADYGVIVGGRNNNINALDYCAILGGSSNRVNGATMATAIGNFITNETSASVEIGHGNNHRKARFDVNGLKVVAYSNFTASVGGTMSVSNTPIASAGSSETNLHFYTIGAHVLTNTNDRLLVRASGRFAANSNTKQIKLIFGSETIFDSEAGVANTGAWTLDGEIIRTGNTSQSCNVSFNGGTNVVFVRTASLDLAQTNGIPTVLKLTGTAAGDGDITNRTLVVTWHSSP